MLTRTAYGCAPVAWLIRCCVKCVWLTCCKPDSRSVALRGRDREASRSPKHNATDVRPGLPHRLGMAPVGTTEFLSSACTLSFVLRSFYVESPRNAGGLDNEKDRLMAHQGDRRRESRHDAEVWDEDNRVVPVTVRASVDRDAASYRSRRPERDGYSGHPGHATALKEAEQAEPSPRRVTSTKAGVDARHASSSSCGSTTCRMGSTVGQELDRRPNCWRRASVRSTSPARVERQGLRRRHEAARLRRRPRLARRAQEPPQARSHRAVRLHQLACLQGQEAGWPHGPRAGHHAQPRGRQESDRRAPACCWFRVLCPRTSAAAPSSQSATLSSSLEGAPEHGRPTTSQLTLQNTAGKRWLGQVDLDASEMFGHRAERPGHAPGRDRPARSPSVQGTQSTKTRSEVRGGGAKPWRQKGTGNVPVPGSIRRAASARGGGIAHGPEAARVRARRRRRRW